MSVATAGERIVNSQRKPSSRLRWHASAKSEWLNSSVHVAPVADVAHCFQEREKGARGGVGRQNGDYQLQDYRTRNATPYRRRRRRAGDSNASAPCRHLTGHTEGCLSTQASDGL